MDEGREQDVECTSHLIGHFLTAVPPLLMPRQEHPLEPPLCGLGFTKREGNSFGSTGADDMHQRAWHNLPLGLTACLHTKPWARSGDLQIRIRPKHFLPSCSCEGLLKRVVQLAISVD